MINVFLGGGGGGGVNFILGVFFCLWLWLRCVNGRWGRQVGGGGGGGGGEEGRGVTHTYCVYAWQEKNNDLLWKDQDAHWVTLSASNLKGQT